MLISASLGWVGSTCRLGSGSYMKFLFHVRLEAIPGIFFSWKMEEEMRSKQVTEAYLKPLLISSYLSSIGQTKVHANLNISEARRYIHFNRRCCKDIWPKYWVYNSQQRRREEFEINQSTMFFLYYSWLHPMPLSLILPSSCFFYPFLSMVPLNSHTASQNGLLHIFPPSPLVFLQQHILHTPPGFPPYRGTFFMLILLRKSVNSPLAIHGSPNASNFSTHIIIWSICVTPVLLLFNIFFNLALC